MNNSDIQLTQKQINTIMKALYEKYGDDGDDTLLPLGELNYFLKDRFLKKD